MKPPNQRIIDLAAELGLSKATVSRALRADSQHMVKEPTRRLVLEAAARAGYIPNAAARHLRSRVNPLVTILLPSSRAIFLSEYYGYLLFGYFEAAAGQEEALETRVQLFSAGDEFEDRYQRQTLGSGAVFYAGDPLDRAGLDVIERDPRPVAILQNALSTGIAPGDVRQVVVGVDNRMAGRLLTEHLLGLGHRRIVFLNGPDDLRDFHERAVGHAEALAAFGLAPHIRNLPPSSITPQGGAEAGAALLRERPAPTAIICANDSVAVGVMESVRQLSRAAQARVSVCGFDNTRSSQQHRPAITTVEQPIQLLGGKASALLRQALDKRGHKRAPHAIFEPSLIVRESTFPAPA